MHLAAIAPTVQTACRLNAAGGVDLPSVRPAAVLAPVPVGPSIRADVTRGDSRVALAGWDSAFAQTRAPVGTAPAALDLGLKTTIPSPLARARGWRS